MAKKINYSKLVQEIATLVDKGDDSYDAWLVVAKKHKLTPNEEKQLWEKYMKLSCLEYCQVKEAWEIILIQDLLISLAFGSAAFNLSSPKSPLARFFRSCTIINY